MPVRHVNLLTWTDRATQEEIDALGAELIRMRAEIAEVRELAFGPDLELMDGNADFAILVDFDDEDAFRRYTAHPAHARMVQEFLRPILADRRAVQFHTPSASS